MAYLLASFLGRIIVVQPHSVGVVWPASGVALVWLASSHSRRQLVVDTVLLSVSTTLVIALTDGSALRSALALLSVIQTLVALWLVRRWVPGIWGTGGRVALGKLRQFGLVLTAVAIGALAMAVVRTALGVLLVDDEGWYLAVGRWGRNSSAMATIGFFGLVLGGWLAERRDRGLPAFARPTRGDLLHGAGVLAGTLGIFYFGFYLHPEVPSTFMLTLTVVWCAIRFNVLLTTAHSVVTGAASVLLTILGRGPISAVGDPETRALLAQVFVVVLLVIGMTIALTRRQFFDTIGRLEQSEAALALRAGELDLVMANLDDGVAIIEEGGRILHANAALRTAFGTQEAQELDRVKDDEEIADDERLHRASDGLPLTDEISPLTRALRGETVPPEEWRPAREDGPIRWVTISAVPLPPDEHGLARAMLVLRDVSKEKIHQDALETRAAELDLVIDKLNDGLAIVEEGGHYVHANDALREIMLAEPDPAAFSGEVPAPSAFHLFHPDGRPLGAEEYSYLRAIRGIEVYEEEWHLRHPDAPPKIVRVSAYPLRVERGGKRRAMVVVRDATRERAYEDSLVSFAGTVAHDLNNPLSVIDGWAEALEEDFAASRSREAAQAAPMIQHIRASVTQARAFISDLLAHTVARDQALDCEEISLSRMVKHIAGSRDRPRNGGEIIVGDLVDVWGDRVLVRQVLDNLIGNAVKYVARGTVPRIVIESERVDEGWARVRVRDNGIGVPPAQQERIFDSFHRASTSESYQGTGLGLAICKRIIQRHGGTIRVTENPDGVGSCFEFTLPTNAEALDRAAPT